MKLARLIFICFLAFGVCSCAHQPPVVSSARPAALVTVASIEGEPYVVVPLGQLMDQAGIPSIISGENYRRDIMVPANRRAEAINLIKKYAEAHKYDVTFY